MIEATEELLEAHSLESLTVSEIVRRARSSVGAFYGRFDDKDALLEYIDEMYGRDAVSRWKAFVEADRREPRPLAETVHNLVERLVVGHRRKRGVARALYLYVRNSHPESAVVGRARHINQQVEELIVGLLRRRCKGKSLRVREQRIRSGLLFAIGAVREAILFGDLQLHPQALDDQTLIDSLTHALVNHLTH